MDALPEIPLHHLIQTFLDNVEEEFEETDERDFLLYTMAMVAYTRKCLAIISSEAEEALLEDLTEDINHDDLGHIRVRKAGKKFQITASDLEMADILAREYSIDDDGEEIHDSEEIKEAFKWLLRRGKMNWHNAELKDLSFDEEDVGEWVKGNKSIRINAYIPPEIS